jgi:uncharacterized membrane protein
MKKFLKENAYTNIKRKRDSVSKNKYKNASNKENQVKENVVIKNEFLKTGYKKKLADSFKLIYCKFDKIILKRENNLINVHKASNVKNLFIFLDFE